MTDKSSGVDMRAARLAAALRANLHKRKAQSRAVARAEDAAPAAVEPGQPDQ